MSSVSYSRLQVYLHWIVAILIVVAWFTHEGMGRALRQRIEQDLSGFDGATAHTIAGGLVLVFVLWRIAVRLTRGAPEPVGPPAVVKAAIWGHRALYALMLVVPALGVATWMGKSQGLGEVHETLAPLLMIVAIGHVVMAIWHGVVKKDGTLARMSLGRSHPDS